MNRQYERERCSCETWVCSILITVPTTHIHYEQRPPKDKYFLTSTEHSFITLVRINVKAKTFASLLRLWIPLKRLRRCDHQNVVKCVFFGHVFAVIYLHMDNGHINQNVKEKNHHSSGRIWKHEMWICERKKNKKQIIITPNKEYTRRIVIPTHRLDSFHYYVVIESSESSTYGYNRH